MGNAELAGQSRPAILPSTSLTLHNCTLHHRRLLIIVSTLPHHPHPTSSPHLFSSSSYLFLSLHRFRFHPSISYFYLCLATFLLSRFFRFLYIRFFFAPIDYPGCFAELFFFLLHAIPSNCLCVSAATLHTERHGAGERVRERERAG